MGFLSKIWRGIKKAVKGVFKAIAKFADSKFGKIVLGALAVYSAGITAGIFTNPFSAGSIGKIGLTEAVKGNVAKEGLFKGVLKTVGDTAKGMVQSITGMGKAPDASTLDAIAGQDGGSMMDKVVGDVAGEVGGEVAQDTLAKEMSQGLGENLSTDIAKESLGKTLAEKGMAGAKEGVRDSVAERLRDEAVKRVTEAGAKQSLWSKLGQGAMDTVKSIASDPTKMYFAGKIITGMTGPDPEDELRARFKLERQAWRESGDLGAGWDGTEMGRQYSRGRPPSPAPRPGTLSSRRKPSYQSTMNYDAYNGFARGVA